MQTLDQNIIEALHNHIQGGGSKSVSAIAAIVGGKEYVEDYKQAMIAAYPESYGDKVKTSEPPVEVAYSMLDAKGVLQPLSVVSSKNGKVILKVTEPEDKVKIMLKGSVQEIDLYQLRKSGSVSPFEGVSVATLLVMGEISKGV